MSEERRETPFKGRKISEYFSKSDFKETVRFILENGDRQTYCNMYNNNPHYAVNDIQIYLNPISQRINFYEEDLSYSVQDYDEITFDDWGPIPKYFRIQLYEDEAWIRYHLDIVNGPSYDEDIIQKYIPMLKKIIKER